MKKAAAYLLAAVLPFLLIIASCSKAKEKTLTICGTIVMDRTSTVSGTNFFQNNLEDFLFTPLSNIDTNYKVHNILIEEARPVTNGATWDIRLKAGVRFHHGKPVTARDVAFSIERGMESGSSRLNRIIQMEAINENILRLRLDSPLSNVSDFLSDIPVYPRDIFSRQDEHWQKTLLRKPVGSGPFKFSRWLTNGIELIANDDYFEGRPKLDKIIYLYEKDEGKRLSHLLKGTADLLTQVSPEATRFIEKDTRFYVNRMITPYYVALFLNNRSPLFNDKTVRRAVNLAINREYLIGKGVSGAGVPAYGPFLKEMLPEDYIGPTAGYDPKTAAQLLMEAGWVDRDGDRIIDKKGEGFRLRLYYPADIAEFKKLTDLIAQQLFEIGIKVEAIPVTFIELMGRYFPSGEYDAILTDIGAFLQDSTWQSKSVHGSNSYNFSDYSNKDVDALLDQARETTDSHEKKRINSVIDKIIHEDAPAVFLYNPVSYSVVNRRFKEAEGFKESPYNFYKIKDWDT